MFEEKDNFALFLMNSGESQSFTFLLFNSISISFSIELTFKNISENKKNCFPADSVNNKSDGVI